jgi:YbbR domain-containing protein
MQASFRWLVRNVSTFLLALTLAVIVWVSAVIIADPNEQQTYQPVDLQVTGQSPDLLLVGSIPKQARLTLQAPRSIWNTLNSDPARVRAWIDLSGLSDGEHTVPVKAQVDASPVRYIQIDPEQVHLVLEPLLKRQLPVDLVLSGNLPLGYSMGSPIIEPVTVTVSGPDSVVSRVVQLRAPLNVGGATETIQRRIVIDAVDQDGQMVSGVTIAPREVFVTQPVDLLGGFKNVAVKVVTQGQVANGYRLTSISVSPPTVTIFSDNPAVVDKVPGYVETDPVILDQLTDDVEVTVDLNLPEGVTLVREPSVLVQVGVAAIEGSITLSVPVELVGLSPELQAIVSPAIVDVIVTGPLNILDKLAPNNFRVIVDLTGLPPGVYQRPVEIDLYPEEVRVQTTLPEIVEVTIAPLPTPPVTLSAPPNPTQPASLPAQPTPTP